jgi:hypothetical protein
MTDLSDTFCSTLLSRGSHGDDYDDYYLTGCGAV